MSDRGKDYSLSIVERNGRTLATITFKGRYFAAIGVETAEEAREAYRLFLLSR